MAHYTRYTRKRVETLLAGIAAGKSVEVSARATGICRKTAYIWRDQDPELRAAWDEAVAVSTDKLEQKLYELAEGGDVTAAIFMLKARKPEVYNPNLLLRKQMLQLALEKARAEMNGTIIDCNVEAMIYPIAARPQQEDEPEPESLRMPRLPGKPEDDAP